MGRTDDCNSCNQRWSTERDHFFSTATPDHISHNQCFRSWTTWATKFCLIRHIHLTSHQPIATCSSISTTFCRENASTTSRRQKMLSKKFVISWSTDFYATGINKQTYFSLAKICWLWWFLFWLIKMCLILVIMIKIHGPKLQLLLFQPNIWLCWVLGVACGVFGLCCGMRDL